MIQSGDKHYNNIIQSIMRMKLMRRVKLYLNRSYTKVPTG